MSWQRAAHISTVIAAAIAAIAFAAGSWEYRQARMERRATVVQKRGTTHEETASDCVACGAGVPAALHRDMLTAQ